MNEQNDIKKKVLTGLIWKFSERILAQLVSLIVSIILARLLMPEDYGSVALIMTFITLANVFVSNGFGSALIQKKNADNLDFSTVFYFNLLFSFIIYILLFVSAPFISSFYHMTILCPTLRVLSVRIPIAAINSVQQAYVSRNMMFKRFFWSTLFGTLVSGIVGILLAYQGFGVWALVAQYLTNTCTDTIVLWFTVKWRPKLQFSLQRAKDLISYGWKLLLSGLLDTGYNELRSLLIGKIYTSSDLAYYNQGDKYPKVIVININAAISSVLFPAISSVQDNRLRVKQMTRRAVQVSAFVMWPLMIGLISISTPLIRLLLTEKWLHCVPYMRIFCITYGLWPIHTANLEALKAIGRSDLFLKLEIVKKILGLAALFVSLYFGPLAIAYSLIVTGIISVFINSYPNRKLLDYGYLEQFTDLLPPLFISIFMAVALWPISLVNVPDFFMIILKIFVGGIIYILVSFQLKQKGMFFIINFLKNRRDANN